VSQPAGVQRLLGAAALVLLGIFGTWAGARLYQKLAVPGAAHGSALKVPVGEASAPTPSDLITDLGEAVRMPTHIPDRLPDFSLADSHGVRTSIHRWDGRALIVNFWATWCEPCRREIPLLESLASRWRDRGMTVVGIAVDERPQVLSFARAYKIDYPLLIGEDDALAVVNQLGFDSPGFPFTVFTDRRGEVVALYLGELHPAQAQVILSGVQTVDDGGVSLTDARHTIRARLAALSSAAG